MCEFLTKLLNIGLQQEGKMNFNFIPAVAKNTFCLIRKIICKFAAL